MYARTSVTRVDPVYVAEAPGRVILSDRATWAASVAGRLVYPLRTPYAAAKWGLVGVSEVLRYDLMQHGIGVTVVCPGAVETPMKSSVEIVGVKQYRAWVATQRAIGKRIDLHKRIGRHAVQ